MCIKLNARKESSDINRRGEKCNMKCRMHTNNLLKEQEDKCICRLSTFYCGNGLNSRDEIKARSRVNYVGS